MLASMRSCFLLFFVVAFSVAAFLPVQAQVNGVAPSVTSMGFGGRAMNGVPPSVTSIGFGNNWSVFGNTNFLLPANPNPARGSGRHHRRHRNDGALVGVIEPAYAPYAPEPNDDVLDADLSKSSAPPSFARPAEDRDSASQADAQTEEPVVPQPATVLVFKDGHQSDVLNYAIVGDTLFDFAAGRTHKILLADLDLKATRKANDDRGVDFQVPLTPTGQ
jgi:hypothetical protein